MGQFVDVHGYYRTLGVAPTATPEQIKSAYKTKAKQLHPDKNKGPGATGLFRDLVEAYGVLNDPASRRAYDEACRAGVPSGQQARTGGATQAPPPEPEPVPFVACQACGTITPDVRAVLIHWVWSFLYFTRHGSNPAVLCPGCAARFIAQANLRSLLFGWWGVPWGPLITPVQVLRNVFGPRGPADVNARLLIQQAIAYATRHDVHNASKCIMQARRYAAGHPDILRDVEEIARLIPMPPHAKSVDPWSSLSPVFRRVTAFSSGGLAAVAAAVVLLVVQPDVSPGRTSATSVTPDVVAEAEPAAPATSEFAPPAESRSPFGQDVTPDGPQSGYDDETAWNAPVEDVVSNDEQVDSAVSYDSSADTFAGEAASPAETTGEEATPDITPGPPDEPSDAQVTIVPAEEPQPEAAQPPVQAEAPATEPEGTADAASTPAPASTETRPAPRVQPT
ncbi:J domain-containing protein, partial [Deinococcus pimensis]|uniref:J domain-containing protein n=1 Tax=Deinococcus pimensis TaxID=309888 RepID=UPI0004853F43